VDSAGLLFAALLTAVSKFRAAQVQHVNATQAVANFLAIYVDGTHHPAESISVQLPALCRAWLGLAWLGLAATAGRRVAPHRFATAFAAQWLRC
jgi:hypothetical protein